jgi:hypothetical protein
MTRVDARIGIGLGWLAAIALAMMARPVHAQAFPQAAAEAVCKVADTVAPEALPAFWAKVDRELKLSDRQRLNVRMFCLGYQRGRLVELEKTLERARSE